MKHLNIDWQAFVGHLPLWHALTPRGQQVFCGLSSSQMIPCVALEDGQPQQWVDAGLVGFSADRTRLRLVSGGREFFKAIRAMLRHTIDDASDGHQLKDYAADHFTVEEREAMLTPEGIDSIRSYDAYSRIDHTLAARSEWIERWLSMSSRKAGHDLEHQSMPRQPVGQQYQDGAPYFGEAAVFEAFQALLRAALEWPEPVVLEDLPKLVPDVDEARLWPAVMAAVRYLVLYPRMDVRDSKLVPVIGIWPQIAYLRHRPAATMPDAIELDESWETYDAPFLVDDMVSVVVAAATEPLRMLASGRDLYQKDLTRLTDALTHLPSWHYTSSDEVHLARLDVAMRLCLDQRLLDVEIGAKQRTQYTITDAGQAWLQQTTRERLRGLIDPWRPSPEPSKPKKQEKRRPGGNLRIYVGGEFISLADRPKLGPWAPPQLAYEHDAEKIDWIGAWRDVLTGNEAERFLPLHDLLDYHGRVNNPLLGRRAKGSYGPAPQLRHYRIEAAQRELYLVRMWTDLLEEVIFEKLIPRGALESASDGQHFAIRLTSIGRYMLGLADDFDYHARAQGEVMVQPNFEVVFMGPAPAAEPVVGRLAERTGQRMGTMFRITRDAILAAAAAGVKPDEALADLDRICAKPLPANVRREMTDWFGSTRRVRQRQTWLLEAPDRETAHRILATAGDNARQLTPTIIEFNTKPAAQSTLIRKLKKAGIFVH